MSFFNEIKMSSLAECCGVNGGQHLWEVTVPALHHTGPPLIIFLQQHATECLIHYTTVSLPSRHYTELCVLYHSRLFCLLSVQRVFSPRVRDDGSPQGIQHHRYVVTDNSVYIGDFNQNLKPS